MNEFMLFLLILGASVRGKWVEFPLKHTEGQAFSYLWASPYHTIVGNDL